VAPAVVRQADGSFLADARASLEDVTAIVGPEFEVGDVANEVDTLAGYIATQIGRVPVRGELIPGPGRFEIEVLDADPRRVKRLKITLTADRPKADARPSTRRQGSVQPSQASTQASTQTSTQAVPPELPVTRDVSVKLSPDAPSKAQRGP
jgi:hypothetical protein